MICVVRLLDDGLLTVVVGGGAATADRHDDDLESVTPPRLSLLHDGPPPPPPLSAPVDSVQLSYDALDGIDHCLLIGRCAVGLAADDVCCKLPRDCCLATIDDTSRSTVACLRR